MSNNTNTTSGADTELRARLAELAQQCQERDARERGLIAIRNNLIDQGKMKEAEAINQLPWS